MPDPTPESTPESTPEVEPEVSLLVSKDKLSVQLTCSWPDSDLEGLLIEIDKNFDKLQIRLVASEAELRERLPEPIDGRYEIQALPIVQGRQSTPPVDGKFEWAEEFFTTEFAKSKSGTVDYRNKQERVNLEADQLIARLIPGVDGEPGMDVFGQELKVTRARAPAFKPGSNIRVEESEDGIGLVYSTVVGRLRFEGILASVDEVFRTPGDVNLETGNIAHPGDVSIQGDVLAGADVSAGGDLEIRGSIEASNIICGGDLKVHGGITSSEKHKVVVSGRVEALFIENADIEAGGDIIVRGEILNSRIKTTGAVVMPGGRILSSTVIALRGIEVGQVGSMGSMPVLLVAAEDFRHSAELDAKSAELTEVKEMLTKLHEQFDALIENADSLPPARAETLKIGLARIDQRDKEATKLEAEIEELVGGAGGAAAIIVRNQAFSEVTLRIKRVENLMIDGKKGPFKAVLGEEEIEFESV